MTRQQTPLSLATPQQRRLLDAYVRHASLKAAAAELHISYQTARNHMRDLKKRTGARSISDAVLWLGHEQPDMAKLSMDLVHTS